MAAAILAAVPSGVNALASVGGLLAGGCSPGCQENLADNNVLYSRAQAGDTQALLNLATVSGGQGAAQGIAGAGNPSNTSLPIWRSGIGPQLLGGWGSTEAELDAAQKYKSAAPRQQLSTSVLGVPTNTSGAIALYLGLGLLVVVVVYMVTK